MNTPKHNREAYQQSAHRFADYYLGFTHDHILDFPTLDKELANLFRALTTCSNTETWLDTARLLQALSSYLDTRGYWAEHRVWLERVVANWDGAGDPNTRIEILDSLAAIYNSHGDRVRSSELYQEVIDLSEASQDEFHVARAYYGLGSVHFNLNHIREARGSWEKGLSISQRIGDEAQAAVIRYFLGTLDLSEAENEQAHSLMDQAIRLAARVTPQLGDIGRHMLIQLRAMSHFARGEDNQARDLYLDALEVLRKEGDQLGTALTLYQLGRIAHRGGDPSLALDYYHESIKIAAPMNDRTGLVALYPAIGLVYLQQQRFDLARPYLEQGAILQREVGDPHELADTLFWLGYALANTGSLQQADQVFAESLELFTSLGSPRAQDVENALSQLHKVMAEENG